MVFRLSKVGRRGRVASRLSKVGRRGPGLEMTDEFRAANSEGADGALSALKDELSAASSDDVFPEVP
jgi:hypothetical protein